MEILCGKCGKKPIFVKKRKLCKVCYQRQQIKEGGFGANSKKDVTYKAEIEFIKTYFAHTNWFYRPTIFQTKTFRFVPAFYDGERNVFIAIAGTRQTFSNNKLKYRTFVRIFSKIKFEVRRADSTVIDINDDRQVWPD